MNNSAKAASNKTSGLKIARFHKVVTRAHLVIVLMLCTSVVWGAAHAQSTEPELQVRAQFVYNFANFVEWPSDAFDKPDAPIKICLFGTIDFAPYLYTFSGTLIGDRELIVQKTKSFNQIKEGCHILYVGEDERVRLPTFWKKIQYVYVLSIGERTGFADKGGIINIHRTQDHIQFDVNIENAVNNGLFLDSDLLSLARTIHRNTSGASGQNSHLGQ